MRATGKVMPAEGAENLRKRRGSKAKSGWTPRFSRLKYSRPPASSPGLAEEDVFFFTIAAMSARPKSREERRRVEENGDEGLVERRQQLLSADRAAPSL